MRTVPRAVWAVTLTWVLMLSAATVLFPPFRAPDEPQHVDLVRTVRQRQGYPQFDDRLLSAQVYRALAHVRFAPDAPSQSSRHLTRDEAVRREDRPSFNELGPDIGIEPNQLPSHPPLYYGIAGAAETLVSAMVHGFGGWPFDRELAMLRLGSVLLLAPLPLLAWATARQLGLSGPPALTAAMVPLAIPQLVHIGATVTNDNLLTLLVGVATLLVARAATGDRSWRTAILLGVVAGLALLTKAFALFLPIWIVLGYLWSVRSAARRVAASRALVASGLALAIGGWWWVRNLMVFGTVQTGIKGLPPAPASFEPDVGWWLGRYLSFMPQRFWGWFGWFDVRLAPTISALATGVVIGAVVSAVVIRPRRGARRPFLVLLMPMAAIAAMVAIGAYQGYLRTGADEGLQGRYLFPGVVGLAVVVAAGLDRLAGGFGRWVPVAVLAAAVLLQRYAAAIALGLYWGERDASLGERLLALGAWSPWPPPVLVAGGLAMIVATASLAGQLIDQARGPRLEAVTPAPDLSYRGRSA